MRAPVGARQPMPAPTLAGPTVGQTVGHCRQTRLLAYTAVTSFLEAHDGAQTRLATRKADLSGVHVGGSYGVPALDADACRVLQQDTPALHAGALKASASSFAYSIDYLLYGGTGLVAEEGRADMQLRRFVG